MRPTEVGGQRIVAQTLATLPPQKSGKVLLIFKLGFDVWKYLPDNGVISVILGSMWLISA